MSEDSSYPTMRQVKELLQRVPNAHMNTRDVLGEWINDAQNVLWKLFWEYDSSPTSVKDVEE